MTDRVTVGNLHVAQTLYDFVSNEALPGTDIDPDTFWSGVDKVVADLTPKNQDLLARRDDLQAQIDKWHRHRVIEPLDPEAYKQFLTEIGYLQPEPDDFTITTSGVDDEITTTAGRSPRMNCFGLHEWAMVYEAPRVRHERVPLRLGPDATDAVVESMPLRCTHFDAFRFFTEPAAARNAGTPSRSDQSGWEQPGCVHANMDLYKWCYKLGPLIESELLFDCLALAAEARELDMRASPYDLADYGFEPIAIETPAGRAAYVRAQQEIAARATPLRAAIAGRCDGLLAAAMAAAGN